jgi:hypothetical protein
VEAVEVVEVEVEAVVEAEVEVGATMGAGATTRRRVTASVSPCTRRPVATAGVAAGC